jgi:hypothetical protein
MAQPTTRRLQTSSTTASKRKPASVATYVRSATHSRFGPVAVNSRPTKSAAGWAPASRRVVTNCFRRLTPRTCAPRIRRATRFRPTRTPRAPSSACTRGAP